MKKLVFLVGLIVAACARGQSTTVINTASPPSWPIGSTNVPISLDTAGRVVLSTGSVTASILDPAEVRAIVKFSIPTDPKKQLAANAPKKPATEKKTARQ